MFGSFFGTKSADTIVDAFINTGDKLVYTDEEKAEMRLEAGKLHIDMLKAIHPFKLTQRFLALWYSLLFGLAFLTGLAMSVFNIIVKYRTPLYDDEGFPIVARQLDLQPLFDLVGTFGLSGIVLAIVVFYFGGGSIESMKTLMRTSRK